MCVRTLFVGLFDVLETFVVLAGLLEHAESGDLVVVLDLLCSSFLVHLFANHDE